MLNDKHVVIWEDAFSPYASVPFFSLFPNILATFNPSCKMRLWLMSSYRTDCSLCLKVWQLQKNPVMGYPSQQLALKWGKTIQERKLLTLCHHQGNRKYWKGMRAERQSLGVEKREGKRSFWRNGPSYKEESSDISLSGKIWMNHSGKSVSLAPRDSVHVYTPKGEKNSRFAFSAQVSLPSFAWTSQEPWKQTYPA